MTPKRLYFFGGVTFSEEASISRLRRMADLIEIVKSYVRDSLSSLTPRHFWALSCTSLILTCVNSHLLTYIPLPLIISRHRQCIISQGCQYWIPTECALPRLCPTPSTSVLGMFATSSLMLYACRSLTSQILFINEHNKH